MRFLQQLGRKLRGSKPAASDTPASSPSRNSSGTGASSRRRKRSRRPQAQGDSWTPGTEQTGSSDRSERQDRRPQRSGSAPRGGRQDRDSRGGRPDRGERPAQGDGPKRRRRRRKPRSDRSQDVVPQPVVDHTPWDPSTFQVPEEEGKTRFHDINLPEELMHAICDLGFQYCTPVQAEVFTKARKGENISGRAQTGTGKTAAFLITIMADFLRNPLAGERRNGTPRALIIAPTRELVIQIAKDAAALGKYTGIRCEAVYGGMDYEKQRRQLHAAPVDIVAATPGRLLDYASKRVIDLSKVEMMVIDEADRMLDMGFIPDVRRIISQTPRKDQRRTMLFSATLTDDVKQLASQWMSDPVEVEIEPEQVATETVEQIVYSVTTRDKFPLLLNLLKDSAFRRVLIFGNRRDRTKRLSERLRRERISCELLSGAVEQRRRLNILENFRSGRTRVLVATDVAGRGIHIDDVTHVINYELPYEPEDYVHRIGRTGRIGTEGTAISFACEDESFIIPDIEAYIGSELPCRVPDEALLPGRS